LADQDNLYHLKSRRRGNTASLTVELPGVALNTAQQIYVGICRDIDDGRAQAVKTPWISWHDASGDDGVTVFLSKPSVLRCTDPA
jgi:hypothetical protein